MAQGVPAHIGTPTPGFGYEAGDPYAELLPPAVNAGANTDGTTFRAVVFVTEGTPKGTERSPQEYAYPLLVLSGPEYATMSFAEMHERICAALLGDRPRCIAESWNPNGSIRLVFEDGTTKEIGPG